MSSRINIARPASGGQAYGGADPHGFGNARPSSSYRTTYQPTNPDDPVEKIKAAASKVEDLIDTYSQPLRPHLGSIGRLLICLTFFEDSWRMMTQWSDQTWYLEKHRGFPRGLSHMFLLINIAAMMSCSPAVVMKRYSEYAVFGLLGVVIFQGFGYGLIFDLNFFLRNLSVVGGLLMVFSDSMTNKRATFAGLPTISESDRRKYFQLAGRVLLIFLFIGFILQGQWSFARIVVSIVGLAACVLVAVGFKAKWAGAFLVIILSVFNVFTNNWWSVHSAHPQRDFLKYDFFQTLSIVGGLLLLVNMGPGGLSVDEKKKVY